jgi:hypothetical protein
MRRVAYGLKEVEDVVNAAAPSHEDSNEDAKEQLINMIVARILEKL